MTAKKFCACGTRISKYSSQCKVCFHETMLNAAREYLKVAATRKCPKCGDPLVPNNTLCGTLWLQCLADLPDGRRCQFQILAGRDEVEEVQRTSTPLPFPFPFHKKADQHFLRR